MMHNALIMIEVSTYSTHKTLYLSTQHIYTYTAKLFCRSEQGLQLKLEIKAKSFQTFKVFLGLMASTESHSVW